LVEIIHLAKRFVGSLSPREPSIEDTSWATRQLGVGEAQLWERMSVADRRHAIGVALDVNRQLEGTAERRVLAAALLHDVGKVDSNLGTFARAMATVVDKRTGPSRFARYRRHDEIGAALLVKAGSDPLTVAWAREHHMPASSWSLPPQLADALKAADDD
jgi:predicted HD phosphohydrolase